MIASVIERHILPVLQQRLHDLVVLDEIRRVPGLFPVLRRTVPSAVAKPDNARVSICFWVGIRSRLRRPQPDPSLCEVLTRVMKSDPISGEVEAVSLGDLARRLNQEVA